MENIREMEIDSYKQLLASFVTVTDFSRYGINRILKSMENSEVKLIMKSNRPVAVMLTPGRFEELLEAEHRLSSEAVVKGGTQTED